MAMLCSGKDYELKFDPKSYVERVLKPSESKFDWNLDFLQAVCEKMDSQNEGKTLIDFGCGPCIHGVISLSSKFEHIYMAEYTEANRVEVNKWINKDQAGLDWVHCFDYLARKEGRSAADIESRVRRNIKGVIPCDLSLPGDKILLHNSKILPVDCIVTINCIGAVCLTAEEYKAGIKKLSECLKPGGVLVLIEVLGESSITIGNHAFKKGSLSRADVELAVIESGFSIDYVELQDLTGVKIVSDAEGVIGILGTKSVL